jgi:hypothetical protein
MWLLLSLVLLALGIMVSRIRDKKFGFSVIFLIWICLVYLLPMGTDQATADRAKSIPSNFQLELEKWNELMNFEERAKIELEKFSDEKLKNDARLNLVENFFKEELKNIFAIEKKLEQSIRRIITFYQKSTVIFPTTFYKSVSHEISGKGYKGSAEFFLYLVDLKYKFCVFIKNKRFYSDDDSVEPFIKDGEENVFYASAQIPGNYPTGMILLAVYAIAMIMGAYFLYKFAVLNMKTADVGSLKMKKEKMDFKKGEQVVYYVKNHLCKDLLYCMLSGIKQAIRKIGFKGSMIVNGTDIVSRQNQDGLTYVCDPKSLPSDSTVGDFLTFEASSFKIPKEQKDKIMEIHGLTGLKKKLIGQVEDYERAEITLALTRMTRGGKSKIYLFYNTARGLGAGFTKRFKDLVMELKQDNALVIYLSTDLEVRVGEKGGYSFFRWDEWNDWVDDNFDLYKEIKKEEQK